MKFELLQLKNRWLRHANELEERLQKEKDPEKRLQIAAEIRVLRLCAEDVIEVGPPVLEG
jgi:hypothetical protein